MKTTILKETKKLLTISICLLAMTGFITNNSVLAESGDRGGNGGDECEREILNIRDEIMRWVLSEGPNSLDVSESNITHKEYRDEMISAMLTTKVSCTSDKVYIGTAEKTCKNYFSDGADRILCNIDGFNKTKDEKKYNHIHHEYAGVAGFEVNNNEEESNYLLTNQLSKDMVEDVVIRLAILPIDRKKEVCRPVKIEPLDWIHGNKTKAYNLVKKALKKKGYHVTYKKNDDNLTLNYGTQKGQLLVQETSGSQGATREFQPSATATVILQNKDQSIYIVQKSTEFNIFFDETPKRLKDALDALPDCDEL